MGTENKKIITGIVAEEPELNKLFQEVLSGIRDDINEAQQNVEMYLDAIVNSPGGKEMYGTLYNEALKIKALARGKQLDFINMFKDRVTKKEVISAASKKETSDMVFDHSQLNRMLDEVHQGKQFENVKPLISNVSPTIQPPINEDREMDDIEYSERDGEDEDFEWEENEE